MAQSITIQPTSQVPSTASTPNATSAFPKARQVKTCQECPYFTNYNEQFGRGWCQRNNYTTKAHFVPGTDCNPEELTIAEDYFSVSVHLTSKAMEEQDGYPVPEDNRVVEVKVPDMTVEEIKKPLSKMLDVDAYDIFTFWQTEIEANHVYEF